MSLDTALSIASNSLANINQAFQVISHNVANADTPGFAAESTTQVSLDAGGIGIGDRSGPIQIGTDALVQNALYAENGLAAGANTTSSALTALQPTLGSVGQGDDLGSALGALSNGFSSLLNDPSSQSQQLAVVGDAQSLTQQINTLSSAYGQARSSAQNGVVSQVAQLNSLLGQVGDVSNQIITLQNGGGNTADLQNQRNQLLTSISSLTNVQFLQQPNGNLLIYTAGGAQLPTDSSNPLSIAGANVGAVSSYANGTLPGIMLGGSDITGELRGGAIGANLTLRDSTLPTYQGELDEFSQNLASRFDAQGLTLFTDGQGNVPAAGGTPAQASYVGFASAITVNPQVVGTPSLVRDGTHAVTGSPTGAAAYTPNPNNLAGFSDLINNVLNYTFGANVQAGVTQPASTTAGLGSAGTLSAPFTAPAALADFANAITASQSADSASATNAAAESTATQSAFTSQLQSATGVDMDSQMSLMIQLQNAYGANAKVISTVQAMYASLLQAIS